MHILVPAAWAAAAIAFVAVDAFLWFKGTNAAASERPAYIGAASAWGWPSSALVAG